MPYRLLLALTVLLALAACGGEDADDSRVLRFTAIPDQNTTELAQRFQPLADHLAARLGVRVEYVPSRDYQASVEMFRNGDVQLAWFGGLTGVQARAAVPDAVAIAQGASDRHYYSYVIANAATGLELAQEFPAAIADFTFTFGSESSTSGRLMPEYFIKLNTGRTPADFFNRPYGFSGSHDKTCELVEAGRFEVGVVNYKVYDRRVADGLTDPDVCRVIWQTPRFADYNFTAHPALETRFGAGFTRKLQAALVKIDDRDLLDALPRDTLVLARNEDYDGIVAVARELGMIR